MTEHRLYFSWVSAAEGQKFADLINSITKEVLAAGPFDPINPARRRAEHRGFHPRGRGRPASDGAGQVVLGYRNRQGRRAPILLTDAAGADQLVYDAECRQNLAAYLRKPEVRQHFPVGVVAAPPGCGAW